MKNEKGVTLVEVLATLTILSLVLGVGFMLFSSVNSLWTNSVDKYTHTSNVNLTLDTISKELTEAVTLSLVTANELQFITFDGDYLSLEYNTVDDTLILYESATNAFNNDYQIITTEQVLQFSIKDSNRETLTAPTPITILNTQLFYFSVTIEDPKVTANGGTQTPIDILIKPFNK